MLVVDLSKYIAPSISISLTLPVYLLCLISSYFWTQRKCTFCTSASVTSTIDHFSKLFTTSDLLIRGCSFFPITHKDQSISSFEQKFFL